MANDLTTSGGNRYNPRRRKAAGAGSGSGGSAIGTISNRSGPNKSMASANKRQQEATIAGLTPVMARSVRMRHTTLIAEYRRDKNNAERRNIRLFFDKDNDTLVIAAEEKIQNKDSWNDTVPEAIYFEGNNIDKAMPILKTLTAVDSAWKYGSWADKPPVMREAIIDKISLAKQDRDDSLDATPKDRLPSGTLMPPAVGRMFGWGPDGRP